MDFESIAVVALLIFLLYKPRFSIIIISLVTLVIFIMNVIYPALMRDGMEDKQSQEISTQSQNITFYLLCILLVVLFLKRYV
jgi:hypothetical protein